MAEFIRTIQTAEGEKQIDYTALANLPITYIESIPDLNGTSDDLVAIRDLTNGFYIFYGKFTPHKGSGYVYTFSDNVLVSVVRKTSASHVQIFYPVNNAMQYLQITDNSYSRQDAKLVNMEDITRRVSTISETSDDEHYPTAKAVYDAVMAATESTDEKIAQAVADYLRNNPVVSGSATNKIRYVEVFADKWQPHPNGTGYYQIVDTEEIPALSMVNIQLTTEQVEIFTEKALTFKTENHSGVLWITVVGQIPENDYVFQCVIEEVEL